jgi:SpoVK/Ycf46/Vps4 family AAA+-type ATPase
MMPLLVSPTAKQGIRHQPIGSMMQVSWNRSSSRPQLRQLGQSTRKGILLYGPPGTGKTHTIRYLASNLPGHTTLIITAAQVALLAQYMSLARLLQPAMVVIEDADLIARDREEMGPCDESLLNELLNQMDGLKQDADILFILTTNRPEQLESALAGRPGRIDQAIEVPLPDDIGRKKLVQLYGTGLPLGDAVVNEAAQRTEGVSAAFSGPGKHRARWWHDRRIRRYQRSAGRHAVHGRQAQCQATGRSARNGRRMSVAWAP